MATSFLSPGVWTNEIDNTTSQVQVGVSTGAGVITAGWGPVLDPQLIDSEDTLVKIFGQPNDDNFKGWFTCANFLSYTNAMYVVRAKCEGARNACTKAKAQNDLVINNDTDYTNNYMNGEADGGQFAAKYPGSLGNSIMVTYADASTFDSWTWTDSLGNEYDFRQYFASAPGTSSYTAQRDGSNDELHLLVIDAGGRISGTKGTVLEKYEYLSKAKDGKTLDGTSNFYKTVLQNQSAYVYWLDYPEEQQLQRIYTDPTSPFVGDAEVGDAELKAPLLTEGNWGDKAMDTVFPSLRAPYFGRMSGGLDDFQATDGDIMEAFDCYQNAETYDVSLIPTAHYSATVAKYVIENIAEVRKDCVVYVSPNSNGEPITGLDILDDTIEFRTGADFNVNSSYGTLDSGWKYQYDKYNDEYRWIPLNGDTAGIYARTDVTNASWWSAAGYNRGQYKNIVKLNWSPNQTQRDKLYQQGINPVVTFQGEGTILYGDKTLLTRPSAFSRLNVRRLFVYLEKTLSVAARQILFEFNDEITRQYAIGLVTPTLRMVQGSRGLTQYLVVCDASNNTDDIINANRFVMDIYVAPNRSVNFVSLNFIAENSGSSVFTEQG